MGGVARAAGRSRRPDGTEVFTKTRADAPPLLFDREALGLRRLEAAGARVPRVLSVDERHLTIAWVEPGPAGTGSGRNPATEAAFGRELAAVHRTTGERFGSLDDEPRGWLGNCPVDLTPTPDWAESWLVRRVVPLARQAAAARALPDAAVEDAGRIGPAALGPAEPPTLVHGDLWAGNRLVDAAGQNWLIDPCAHYGHREVDLAMMDLFGGFGPEALDAYQEEFPLAPGWEQRIPVYQAVPLLVHAILFGGGYGRGPRLRVLIRPGPVLVRSRSGSGQVRQGLRSPGRCP